MGLTSNASQVQTSGSQTNAGSTSQSGTSVGFWGSIEDDIEKTVASITSGVEKDLALPSQIGSSLVNDANSVVKTVEIIDVILIIGLIVVLVFVALQLPKIAAAL